MKTIYFIAFLLSGLWSTGQDAIQITSDPANDWDPHWSPDGQWFCFTSNRAGSNEIWSMKINGDSATQLTFDDAGNMHPCWSPDGTSILFTSDRGGNNDIWMKEIDLVVQFEPQDSRFKTQVYPNPCSSCAYLRFTIHDSQSTIADLFMISGRWIRRLVDTELEAGSYQLDLNFNNLPDGYYLICLQAGNDASMVKVLIVH